MEHRKRNVALAVLAAIIIIAGCGGNPVRNGIEKSVLKELPALIGQADSYVVRAYGPTLRLMNGKLDGLDITGRNVRFGDRLTVSQLDVRIRGLVVDPDTHEIKRADSTQYTATISETELNAYLKRKHPRIDSLKIDLRDGDMAISARPGVSVLKVNVRANAALEVHNRRVLSLDLQKLKVAGIGAPEFARSLIDARFDTIFDARDLGFDAEITSAEVRPSALVIDGALDLMKLSQHPRAEL